MDSSDSANPGCPCLQDYVQIGADHYGIYITSNEYSVAYDPNYPSFNNATVLAITKADLASGAPMPRMSQFIVPFSTGYEFAIRPAAAPPGAANFLANGGVEFLVSSSFSGYDNHFALWAMTNTASLQSSNPTMLLTQTFVSTSLYYYLPPNVAFQRPGPLTLSNMLEYLDAGYFSDSRVLSTVYSGGRLYVTLASAVLDSNSIIQAGGFYAVFAPTLRNGMLSSTPPDKQGYLAITNDAILRPAISVNAQGRGAIAFSVSGPDYYPSVGFVNFDLTNATPSSVQISAQGFSPEDGFSGSGPVPLCPTCSGNGVARWGDFSTAVTSTDGSIWFSTEYIPNLPRTPLANWGTFIGQHIP